jgi:hypothetical protein
VSLGIATVEADVERLLDVLRSFLDHPAAAVDPDAFPRLATVD